MGAHMRRRKVRTPGGLQHPRTSSVSLAPSTSRPDALFWVMVPVADTGPCTGIAWYGATAATSRGLGSLASGFSTSRWSERFIAGACVSCRCSSRLEEWRLSGSNELASATGLVIMGSCSSFFLKNMATVHGAAIARQTIFRIPTQPPPATQPQNSWCVGSHGVRQLGLSACCSTDTWVCANLLVHIRCRSTPELGTHVCRGTTGHACEQRIALTSSNPSTEGQPAA